MATKAAKVKFGEDGFVGFHNADLDATTTRLIRGGSWKRQRVVVLMAAGKTIPTRVYLSHVNLQFPPNNGVARVMVQGEEVGQAYTKGFETILQHPDMSQWEYVLTIEHDNLCQVDSLLKLIERMETHPEFAVIGGLYFMKGEGGTPMIFGDPTDPVLNFRPQLPVKGELVECCGTGMGFTLWRLSIFHDERLRRPWFKTIANKKGIVTQDLYFFRDARQYGYRCAVDCGCPIGHFDLEGNFGPPETMW